MTDNTPSSTTSTAGPDTRLWLMLYPLALLLRLTNYRGVLTPVGVFPQATDSYYHLRRIFYAVQHYPHVLDADRYLNFPNGGPVYWPFGFDLLYATFVKIFTLGHADMAQTAAISSWLTPLFSAVTPCLVYALGKQLGHARIGLWAGLLMAMLPAVTITGGIGYIDHHVFESLWLSAYLLAYLKAVQATPEQPGKYAAYGAGLAITAGLLCTTILPLLLPLHAGLLACQMAHSWKQSAKRKHLLDINIRLLPAMLITLAPFVATRFAEPSGVNPALSVSWLAGLVLYLAVLGFGCFESRSNLRSAGQAYLWGLAGCALLGTVVVLRTDLRAAAAFVGYGIGHLHAADPWLATIQESQPLLKQSLRYVLWSFTGFIVLWPMVWVWMLMVGWRHSIVAWSIAVIGLPTMGIAFLQLKFWEMFAVPYTLAMGFFIHHMLSRYAIPSAPEFKIQNSKFKTLGPLGCAAAIVLLLWPTLSEISFTHPFVVMGGNAFVDLQPTLVWIAEHTPPTTPTATADTDYAIAGDWNVGHWLVWFGGRPVVTSPLGHTRWHREGIRDGAAILMFPPEQAVKLMERRRVRYVLVTPIGPHDTLHNACWDEATNTTIRIPDEEAALRVSLFAELLGRDAVPGEKPSAAALRHFRLVHESTPDVMYPGLKRPFAMLFERVPGAKLHGVTAPNAKVAITAKVRTAAGREFVYRDSVTADNGGEFFCTVPYAAGSQQFSEVGLVGSYTLEADGKTAEASITETEVMVGTQREIVWLKNSKQ